MLFLLKYRFLQIVREFSVMFWALAFPLILATLFYFSFGSAGLSSTGESEWDKIKVCNGTANVRDSPVRFRKRCS